MNHRDNYGLTPVFIAVQNGKNNWILFPHSEAWLKRFALPDQEKIVEKLAKNSADVNPKNGSGQTALHAAINSSTHTWNAINSKIQKLWLCLQNSLNFRFFRLQENDSSFDEKRCTHWYQRWKWQLTSCFGPYKRFVINSNHIESENEYFLQNKVISLFQATKKSLIF